MRFLSVDLGLDGSIIWWDDKDITFIYDMPTIRKELKATTYKFKHKDKSIVYKTGAKKGQRQKVVRTKGKYKRVLDFDMITKIIKDIDPDMIISERIFVQKRFHAVTPYTNEGFFKGLAYATGTKWIKIEAQAWQKYFNVNSKEDSIKLVNNLEYTTDITKDGISDGILIGLYYLKKEGKI